MALSERYSLVSVEILVQSNQVQMRWDHEIVKDGEVISSTPHRGAYPRGDDGQPLNELAPALEDVLSGLSLGTLQQLQTANEAVSLLTSENSQISAQLAEKDAYISQLNAQLTALLETAN